MTLAGTPSGPALRVASYATRPVGLGTFLLLRMFCVPFESLAELIVAFLMSTPWIVPLRICLPVITVAATALPAQAITTATIETASAGLGGRSFIRFSPVESGSL